MPFGRGGNAFRMQGGILLSTKTPLPGEGEGRLQFLSGEPGDIPDWYSREALDYLFSLNSFALATAGMM